MGVHQAGSHLARLLERVAAGEHIVISREGKPVADLVPHQLTVEQANRSGAVRRDESTADIIAFPHIQRIYDDSAV